MIIQNSERLARSKEQLHFLNNCHYYGILPPTIMNIHLPNCFNDPRMRGSKLSLQISILNRMRRYERSKVFRLANFQRHFFTETNNSIKLKEIASQAFKASQHFHGKRLLNKLQWLMKKQIPNVTIHETLKPLNVAEKKEDMENPQDVPQDNTYDSFDKSILVTDLTKSLNNEEIKLLSKGPKFAIHQGMNNNIKQDMKIAFCRLAYHLRWRQIIETQDENTPIRFIRYPESNQINVPRSHPSFNNTLMRASFKLYDLIDSLQERKFGNNLNTTEMYSLKSLQKKDYTFLPSDKGTEFCVVETTKYNGLITQHLSNTEIYEKCEKITIETISTKINKVWKSICKKRCIGKSVEWNYKKQNPKFPKFYCLIKTHKSLTDLKIRPIVSCINGPSQKLTWLITQLLNPLLADVPAHLRNSIQLIQKLKSLGTKDITNFPYAFSLDVSAMYTSIPIQEAIKNAISMLQERNFYYHGLTAADIEDLLIAILDNNYFIYANSIFKQKYGLPMGSSVSGVLAILFMNSLERQILSHPNIGLYARYIDDIFILTTTKEEATRIQEIMNSLHENIDFTIEHSTNGTISLLDFTLTIADGSINFNFYKKQAKKPLFVNYKSALPTNNKINFVRNERKRITERCSNTRQKQNALQYFSQVLKLNDYPENLNHITTNKTSFQQDQNKQTEYSYYKIPFISDDVDNRIKAIFQDLNLPVRIAHHSYTLRSALNKKPQDPPSCTWKSCLNTDKDNCLKEMVVYQISCVKCKELYIGSTIRKLHTRVTEHLKSHKSSIKTSMRVKLQAKKYPCSR